MLNIPCICNKLPSDKNIVVGLSGGVDSVVLLHLLYHCLGKTNRLQAIHVNHNLQPESESWANYCEQTCRELDIPLTVVSVALDPVGNVEEKARLARYSAFRDNVPLNSCLCLAHHQNDQVETVIYRLVRGSGPKGLAGIRQFSNIDDLTIIRPLLDIPKKTILALADELNLAFCTDNSNDDISFDRNYIRHVVLPSIEKRWPAACRTITRFANHANNIESVLTESCKLLLPQFKQGNTLSIAGLFTVSKELRFELIRQFIDELGYRAPTLDKLERIEAELMLATKDKNPSIEHDGGILRRYRDSLYLLDNSEPVVELTPQEWNLDKSLITLADGRKLSYVGSLTLKAQSVQVSFANGGDKLKKICQQHGIPPWERHRIPLIRHANKLCAIVGYWCRVGYEGFSSC